MTLFDPPYPETLYDGRPPAERQSETSREAADSIVKPSARLQARVLACITRAPDGRTCDEVEELLDGKHQTISPRVRELVLLGQVVKRGDKRKTRSGRNAVIYVRADD